MSLARLRKIVGPGLDLEGLHREHVRLSGDADPMVFAIWLLERRDLTIDQLRAYLLDGDLYLASKYEGAPADYERMGLLGKGAMGEVYVARDRRLNRNVAVKSIDPGMAADAVLLRRFYTEAQITAQLDHPGIVPVFGLEVAADGSLAYAMRIVRGQTLREWIDELRGIYEQGAKPPPSQQLQARLLLFEDLCKVILHAHERGVVHRDLKPRNIMVGPYGEVLVMDWGIAKVVGRPDDPFRPEVEGENPELTQMGVAIGTARYMSPEQASGRNDELDARSDQYALGLLLFELVTLQSANPGRDAETCRTAAKGGVLAPIVHFRGEPVPRDLEAIIRKATERRRDDRYPDVGFLAEDVRRFLRDEEVSVRPDGLLQRAARTVGRYRRAALVALSGLSTALVGVVAAAIAVLTAVILVYAWTARRREASLSRFQAEVAAQAQSIDRTLQGHAEQVEGLRGAATYALTHPPPGNVEVYFEDDFHEGSDHLPEDLVFAPAYDMKASLDHPDNVLRPGLAPESVAVRLQQLQSLQPEFLNVLSWAVSPELARASRADRAKALLDEGGPLIWVYVATEEGILTGYPGVGDYPENYDPRTSVWYPLALATEGVAWEVSEDESGQGLLLTGAVAIRAPSGTPLGIAALDLTVSEVTDALLLPEDFPPVRAALVDADGRVLIDSNNPLAAEQKRPLEYAEVVEAMKAGRSGGLLETSDELVAWTLVEEVGWTYVVAGATGPLLSAF